MRRIILMLVAAVVAAAVLAPAAFAAKPEQTGNPHFIANATTAVRSGNDLVVSFKETGLPSGQIETVTASATATTVYSCVNNGTSIPSDKKKTRTASPVQASGQFTADRSGNIEGSLTLSPPSAEQVGLTCPPGQTATLISVTYSNVRLVDSTSGATFSFSGTF